MIIYLVTNKINNKKYIGQTIRPLQERKQQHISSANNKSTYLLHRAIRKHGEENFTWEIVKECVSINELNELEVFYIKEYETFGEKGYNLTNGGHGTSGWKHSKETKHKIGEFTKIFFTGRKKTEEHKEKLRTFFIGKNYVERFGKEKAKEIINKKKLSYIEKFGEEKAKEIKTKLSNSNKSKLEEVKNKMSISHKKNLDINGKRTDLNEISIKKMKDSKIGENNHQYIKMSNNDIDKLIKIYTITKKVNKELINNFNYSRHILIRTLKELKLWQKK